MFEISKMNSDSEPAENILISACQCEGKDKELSQFIKTYPDKILIPDCKGRTDPGSIVPSLPYPTGKFLNVDSAGRLAIHYVCRFNGNCSEAIKTMLELNPTCATSEYAGHPGLLPLHILCRSVPCAHASLIAKKLANTHYADIISLPGSILPATYWMSTRRQQAHRTRQAARRCTMHVSGSDLLQYCLQTGNMQNR